jgi:hypothetical protein
MIRTMLELYITYYIPRYHYNRNTLYLEISVSHGGQGYDVVVLGCDAVCTCM